MKLQKPLTVANRLPAPELRSLFTKHSDEASAKYDSLAQSLRATLGEIQSLQKELLSRNPSLCEPASLSRGTKRGLEEKQLDDPVQLHEHIMPLLDPVIEKWQAKTQIASGGAAGKKFRALNQVRIITPAFLLVAELRVVGECAS